MQNPTGGESLRVRVAVDAPLMQPLSYLVPEGMDCPLAGTRVQVPLGSRRVAGVVLGPDTTHSAVAARPISQILEPRPSVPADVLALAEFVATYYRAAPGEVLKAALPPGMGSVASTRLRLTQQGTSALRASFLSGLKPAEQAVLEALANGPRTRRSLLRHGFKGGTLSRLLQQELLEELDTAAAPKERRTRYYSLLPDCDLSVIGPRASVMLAVVELLQSQPEQSTAQLEERVPGARSALRRLQQKKIVQFCERQSPLAGLEVIADLKSAPPELSPAQSVAVKRLEQALADNAYRPFLLFGVTSSGKTEVYLNAVQRALELGRGALVLVPEIALTPQLVGRFQSRLKTGIEVLHSALPVAERRRRWQRVRSGEARCVIGARSAIFAPVQQLGLIVVDEEHEPSYKQEESPRYHARDLAMVRAQHLTCPVVLGSATPSLESYHRAQTGKLGLLTLEQRVAGAVLPQVEVVELKPAAAGMTPNRQHEIEIFSPQLVSALETTLSRGEQAILFLNRRGFAHFVICLDCGQTVGCPNCSVTLTHHRAAGLLICHYCGHRQPVVEECERCQGISVVPFGLGTERLEQEVAQLFPGARVGRIDRDTTRRRGELVRQLGRFAAHEMDILVGTQMLAKGHDYPHVTLVGVLVADVGLAVADFRAAERTFQLLAQVSGRAGRGSRPGRVVVQAFDVEHPAILAAQQHDYLSFAREELKDREALRYPPFGRLAVVRLEAKEPSSCEREAAALLRSVRSEIPSTVQILGPAPAPLAKLRGVSRFQILIKASTVRGLQLALNALSRAHSALVPAKTRLIFDVDPALVL